MNRLMNLYVLLIALFFAAAIPRGAYSQQPAFTKIPLPDEKKTRELQKQKRDMLRGSTDYVEATVKEYYEKHLFPKLTTFDAPDKVNEARVELLDDFLNARTEKFKEASRVSYTKIAFSVLNEATKNRYHPLTRLTSIYVIGQLDSKPPTKTTPPVPYADAFGVLGSIISNSAKVVGPPPEGAPEPSEVERRFADAFMFQAMVGMERHIRVSSHTWDSKRRITIGKFLTKLVTDPIAPTRAPAVHSYLQRRVLEMLAFFESDKAYNDGNPAVKEFMLSQIKDKNADSWVRLYCIRALKRPHMLAGMQPTDVEALNVSVIHFMKQEVSRWKDSIQDPSTMMSGMGMPGGMPGGMDMGMPGTDVGMTSGAEGGMMPGGMPGDMGMEGGAGMAAASPLQTQPADVRIARRRLNMILEHARSGIDGETHTVRGKPASEIKAGILSAIGQNGNDLAQKDFMEALQILHDVVNGIAPPVPGAAVPLSGQTRPNMISLNSLATLRSVVARPVDVFIEACKDYPGVLDIDDPIETSEVAVVEGAATDASGAVAPAAVPANGANAAPKPAAPNTVPSPAPANPKPANASGAASGAGSSR